MKLKWVEVSRSHYMAGGSRFDYHVKLEHGVSGWQLQEQDWVHNSVIGSDTRSTPEAAQELAQEWEDLEARALRTPGG